MLLSPYIHIILLISCAVFSYSAFAFIKRVQASRNLIPSQRNLLIYDYHEPEKQGFNYVNLYNQTQSDASNGQIDEKTLRQRVFGSEKAKNPILDRFTYINPPKPICNYPMNTDDYVIFIVLSRGLNFDFRQAIRATWGRNGKQKGYTTQIQTIFFVGTHDGVDKTIRLEQEAFNDVVEIIIPDSYPFVAHKELACLLWTRLYCPFARMIFRADDDILLDTFRLLNQIAFQIDFETKDGMYGWFRLNNTVHRADKWAVTKMEYPLDQYPPYTFGIGYLFSNVSCQRLVDAANLPDHQIIRIGDAYITGILRDSAGIPFYDFVDLEFSYTFFNPIACDEHFEENPRLLICMSKLHTGSNDDPFEFYEIWNIILAKHKLLVIDRAE